MEAVGTYLQAKYQLPGIEVPSSPTNVQATAVSSTQVSVIWNAGTATSQGVIYTVERKTGNGNYSKLADVDSNPELFG